MNIKIIPIKVSNTSITEIYPENSQYKIVYIDIVHRCNMECANCYLPNRDYADVSLEKIKEFVDRFKHKVEFRLIGGEPTLHKDLDKIIQHIKQNSLNHRVLLITNGLKLASKKYLKTLTSAGLKHVYISMNGFNNNDVYEKLDNLRCAKNKMLALKNCLQEKMTLSIGFIIVRHVNEHLILKMKEFFKSYENIVNFEFINIGEVGRNIIKDQKIDNYNFNDIKDLVLRDFGINDNNIIRSDEYSALYKVSRNTFVHIHNWKDLPNGFDEHTNQRRGRMTENFLVAPFLEHIVENEGRY